MRGWVTFSPTLRRSCDSMDIASYCNLCGRCRSVLGVLSPRLPTCDHAPDAQGPRPVSRRRPHVRLHVRPSPAGLPGQPAGQGQCRAVAARHDPGAGGCPAGHAVGRRSVPPRALGLRRQRASWARRHRDQEPHRCGSRATRWPGWKATISPSRTPRFCWKCASSASATRPRKRRRATELVRKSPACPARDQRFFGQTRQRGRAILLGIGQQRTQYLQPVAVAQHGRGRRRTAEHRQAGRVDLARLPRGAPCRPAIAAWATVDPLASSRGTDQYRSGKA